MTADRTVAALHRDNTSVAIRNATFSLLSLGCRLAGNMVVFVIIARLPGVDPADFGQMTYATALTSLFVMVSQFGLTPFLVREIAANPPLLKTYARAAISLRLLLSAVGAAAIFIYVNSIGMSSQGRMVCYIIGLAYYIGSFSTDFQAFFQSRERMHLELVGIVVENMLLLVLSLAAFIFHSDIVQVACIFLLAKSVALAFNYFICGRFLIWVRPALDFSLWKRMLAEAAPFALTGLIAAGIVQFDTVLMRELIPGNSEEAVGLYQAAIRLAFIPMLLPEIASKVLLPQLSRMHGRFGSGLARDLGRVNHPLLTFGLLFGIVTVFRGQDLINLIYGDKYLGAGPLLQLMGFTIMLRFGAAYSLYFTIRNRIWFRMASGTLALAAIVVLDFLLIPRYGATGAAYASILGNVIYWLPYLVTIHAAEKTVALGWDFRRAGVVGAVLAVFLYATAHLDISYMLAVYAVLVPLGVLISMSKEDRERILSHLPVARA